MAGDGVRTDVGGWKGELRGEHTNVFVLNVSSRLALELGLSVGLVGEMLDEHFLPRVSRHVC